MNSTNKKQPLFMQEITLQQIKKDYQCALEFNTNARKVIQSIQQKLLEHTQHKASSLYFNKFIYPTFDKKLIFENQKIFKSLLSNQYEKLINIANLNSPKKIIRFPFEFYTCDESIYRQLQSLTNIYLLSEKELAEFEQQGDASKNTFVVSEERYLGEISQLRFNEVKELLQGYTNSNNIEIIKIINTNILKIIPISEEIKKCFRIDEPLKWDFEDIDYCLNKDIQKNSSQILEYIKKLPHLIELENQTLKHMIKNIQLELQGEDLIEMLQSNDTLSIQQKLQSTLKDEISNFEKKIQNDLQELGFSKQILFSSKKYPLELDEDVIDTLYREIEEKENQIYLDFYFRFSKPTNAQINTAIEYIICYDLLYSMQQFLHNSSTYATIDHKFIIEDALNPKIKHATPITYALNTDTVKSQSLNNESISVLTGANSGGKTTLLELVIIAQYLGACGLPLNSKQVILPIVEEVIYLKKFSGTVGSGAFEQTIRELLNIVSTPTSKILLIDEFEAITEPGAAATILTLFLEEISNHNIYCISVSHLGKEIKHFIDSRNITSIRIDGISAQGLDSKGNLITNHQPIFNSLGESTPELILQRIYSDDSFFKNKTQDVKNLLLKIINYKY